MNSHSLLKYIKTININDRIDVKDTNYDNKWYIATVINIDNNDKRCLKLRIHYDGWAIKYDENIDVQFNQKISHRIAPLLTHTCFHNYFIYPNVSTCGKNTNMKACKICNKYCCIKCNAINTSSRQCEQCANKNEYHILRTTLQKIYRNKIKTNIIELIVIYSMGLVVECSNFISCNIEINFKNKWQFNQCMDITGRSIKQRRIFCNDCCQKCKCSAINTSSRQCEQCVNKKKYHILTTIATCEQCNAINTSSRQCEQCVNKKEYHILTTTLQKIYKNKIKANIIELIVIYSMGLAVECSNFISCNNEINFKNKWQFKQCMDITGQSISYYSLNTQLHISTHHLLFQSVYDKQRRIFCNDCCQNLKFIKCQYKSCQANDIFVNTSTTPKCYPYSSYRICNNHINCKLCGFQPLSDAEFTDEFTQCIQCIQYYCVSCYSSSNKQCILCEEQNKIADIIDEEYNIKNTKIIECIAEFSVGLLVQCSNYHHIPVSCPNKISVINKRQLNWDIDCAGNKISHYSIQLQGNRVNNELKHDLKYHLLYNKYRRIFCTDCTANLVQNCEYNICHVVDMHVNKHVRSHIICNDHKYCELCNFQAISDDELIICTKCNKYCCIKCHNRRNKKCKICIDNKNKQMLVKTIDNISYFHFVSDINILYIIAEYCIGYVVNCCSLYSCQNEICILNKYDLKANIDVNNNKISWYKATDAAIYNGVYVFNELLIIFCSDCVKNDLRRCKWREYGERCKNYETCSEICQKHPNVTCNECGIRQDGIRQDLQDVVYCARNKCRNYICFKCCVRLKKFECIHSLRVCSTCLKSPPEILSQKVIIKEAIKYNISIANDDKIITLIANYSIGYIVHCSNSEICNNLIGIDNKYDMLLNKDNECKKIYYYTSTFEMNSVNLYGKQRRIFCGECVMNVKITKCNRCNNMDIIGNNYCQKHKLCYLCGHDSIFVDDELFCCEKCDKYFCSNCCSCYYCGWCNKCMENESKHNHYDINNDILIQSVFDYRFNKMNRELVFRRKNNKRKKTRNKKKLHSYFKNKDDKKQNQKSKKKFNKRYALLLQY